MTLCDPFRPLEFESLPGFNRLFSDYVRGIASPSGSWPTFLKRPTKGERLELQPRPHALSRETVCRLLTRQQRLFKGGTKALENIEVLSRGSTGIVLVTLSVATAGGTLQDLNKCLTAARVCRYLSDNGSPAIPMVWIDPGPRNPIRDSTGASGASNLVADLIERLGVDPKEEEAVGLLEASYQERDESLALGRFLSSVLSRWGMVFFSPHLEANAGGLPPFAAETTTGLEEVVQQQAALLRDDGYGWPDGDLDFASLLLDEHRNRFWPIIVQIVGEEELVRLAHGAPIFEFSRTPVGAGWPRASTTLVDRRSQKTLGRYRVCLPDLFLEFDHLVERVSSMNRGRETSKKLQSLRDSLEARLSRLSLSLPDDGRALTAVVEDSRRKMLYQIGKLQDRFRRSLEARQSATTRQLKRVCEILAPNQDLQERHLSVPEGLIRFSPDLPDRIYDEIDIWKWEHLILRAN